MKKFLVIILLVLSLCVTGCGFNKDKQKTSSNNSDDDFNIIFSQDDSGIEKDSVMYNLFAKLSQYGKEIYDNGSYINYSKKNGAYFASLESLKDKYDVSGFVGEDGTACDTKKSGIYFDPDKKLGLNYEERDPITPILIGCSKDQR